MPGAEYQSGLRAWKHDFEYSPRAVRAVSGQKQATVLADDSLGHSQPETGSPGIEPGACERLKEPWEDVRVDSGTVVGDGDGDPLGSVAGGDVGADVDPRGRRVAAIDDTTWARANRVDRVAQQIHEDLHHAIRVAFDKQRSRDGVVERDGFQAAIEPYERRGLINDRTDRGGCRLGTSRACVVQQSLPKTLETPDDAEHQRGRIAINTLARILIEFLDESLEHGQGRVKFVGDAGGHHAQTGEAIGVGEVAPCGFEQVVLLRKIGGDFFELRERPRQVSFVATKFDDRLVARAHDLAEFIRGNRGLGYDFLGTATFLHGLVGVQHATNRAVNMLRQHEHLQREGDQAVHREQRDDEQRVEGHHGRANPVVAHREHVVHAIGGIAREIGDGLGGAAAGFDQRCAGLIPCDGGEVWRDVKLLSGACANADIIGGPCAKRPRVGNLALGFGRVKHRAKQRASLARLGLSHELGHGRTKQEQEDAGQTDRKERMKDDEFLANAHAREDGRGRAGSPGLGFDVGRGSGHRGVMELGDSRMLRRRSLESVLTDAREHHGMSPAEATREGDVSARACVIRRISRQAERFPDLDLTPLDTSALDARDAALAHAMHDAVLRHWLGLTYLLDLSLTKPMAEIEAKLRAVLLVGAAQLLLLERVPDYAAINESVSWAKRHIRPGAGGVVNAVLRKVAGLRAGEGDAREYRERWSGQRDEWAMPDGRALVLRDRVLPEAIPERVSIATSHPRALVEAWLGRWPWDRVRDLAWHSLGSAPVILNTRHAMQGGGELPPELVRAHERPGHHVFTGDHAALLTLLRERRDVWVQDPASASVIAGAANLRPRRILDICAGTGTKTRQLAATFPEAEIIATEIDPARLAALRTQFQGSSQVRVMTRKDVQAKCNSAADLILLDVPCSNTGVLARRVEAKYRAGPAAWKRLSEMQRQIIADSIPLRAVGGTILYATCSIEPAENEAQAAWAGKWHGLRIAARESCVPTGEPGGDTAKYHDGAGWFALA